MTITAMNADKPSEEPESNRRIAKLGGYTRDRRGCITCRKRKKKCVDRPPSSKDAVDGPSDKAHSTGSVERCWPCTRLNLRCLWEEERTLQPNHRQTSSLVVRRHPRVSLVTCDSTGDEDDMTLQHFQREHQETMLGYYLQHFAKTLSTNTEDNNGFIKVLLPMALNTPPLLDALVAYSAAHMALSRPQYQVRSLEDRSIALRSFAQGIGRMSSETTLAICLVLTSMEAILGNTENWYQHMGAAAKVVSETAIDPGHKTITCYSPDTPVVESTLAATEVGKWLLRNFAYHDILASISLRRRMLIPQLQWISDHNELDTYLGVGSHPMQLLGQINNIANELDESGFKHTDASTVLHRLHRLENELMSFRADSTTDPTLAASAESYRSAALICLYRTLRYHRLSDLHAMITKIEAQVDQVISCIDRLQPGSRPECTLLFPLFIAGGETSNVEHQTKIEDRMKWIARNRRFDNITKALEVLQEVWSVREQMVPRDPARPYDWTVVLQRRNWDLALS